MKTEKTLALIKPDAVQRGLVGQIVHRYERKGLKLVALKLLHLSEQMAAELYKVHLGKPFYESLVDFMTTDPIVAICLEGQNAVEIVRLLNGALPFPGGTLPKKLEKKRSGESALPRHDREVFARASSQLKLANLGERLRKTQYFPRSTRPYMAEACAICFRIQQGILTQALQRTCSPWHFDH